MRSILAETSLGTAGGASFRSQRFTNPLTRGTPIATMVTIAKKPNGTRSVIHLIDSIVAEGPFTGKTNRIRVPLPNVLRCVDGSIMRQHRLPRNRQPQSRSARLVRDVRLPDVEPAPRARCPLRRR